MINVAVASSTVSAGEVSNWGESEEGETIIVYQFGPFGPFTITPDLDGEPINLAGKTLRMICENTTTGEAFEFGTDTGELTITGDNNKTIVVSDGSDHTQVAGTFACNIRDVTPVTGGNKVIAKGPVNVVKLPVEGDPDEEN